MGKWMDGWVSESSILANDDIIIERNVIAKKEKKKKKDANHDLRIYMHACIHTYIQ